MFPYTPRVSKSLERLMVLMNGRGAKGS
jgi:hypothetical protein